MISSSIKKILARIALLAIMGGIMLFIAPSAFAEGYKLTVPFPGQPDVIEGPAGYIKMIYNFAIVAGGILAIAMIVYGGIRYTVSEVVPSKEEAKDIIRSALLGLALLLAAFLIMRLINPQLGKLEEPGLPPLPQIPPPQTGGETRRCGDGIVTPPEQCEPPGRLMRDPLTDGVLRCSASCGWTPDSIPGV